MRRLWKFGGGKEDSGQLRVFEGFERLISTFSATISAVASWYLCIYFEHPRRWHCWTETLCVYVGPLFPISRGQVFAAEEQINIDDEQSCTMRGITLMFDARIQIGLGYGYIYVALASFSDITQSNNF